MDLQSLFSFSVLTQTVAPLIPTSGATGAEGSALGWSGPETVANCRLQGTKRALIRNTKFGAKVAFFAFTFCISLCVRSPLLITIWRSYRGLRSLKKRNNIAYIVYYSVERNHQTFVLWLFFSFMLSLHI